ncbi:hypothetical protein [Streptomyces sp. NPDC057781]|uniref:hypothetical protein n=1 Tax=unclassified Streptomyces TaxID=2593676 RepID=UPI003681AB6E
MEVEGFGIKVTIVQMGGYNTGLFTAGTTHTEPLAQYQPLRTEQGAPQPHRSGLIGFACRVAASRVSCHERSPESGAAGSDRRSRWARTGRSVKAKCSAPATPELRNPQFRPAQGHTRQYG